MRVALDATPLLGTRTGVGAFVTGLTGALAAHTDLDLVGFGLTWRGRRRLPAVLPDSMSVVRTPMPARPLRALWLRLDWPPVELATGACDVVHGTNFVVPPTRGAGAVVTVHDLTAVRFPEMVERATAAFPALIRRALRRGAFVHTPSEFVREEVIDVFGADPEQVAAVHHGVAAVATSDGGGRVKALVEDRPYVLSLGTLEPRKNVASLVRAFDLAAREQRDLVLVVAGAEGWGAHDVAAAIDAAHHKDRVVRLGYVSDADRAALLRGARVFAFPSVYEGFGFPPLEAMAAGVPVVSTRAGALPEVLGDGAAFVDHGDVDALAATMCEMASDETRRAELVARGTATVQRYRWETTATEMRSLYERVAR